MLIWVWLLICLHLIPEQSTENPSLDCFSAVLLREGDKERHLRFYFPYAKQTLYVKPMVPLL